MEDRTNWALTRKQWRAEWLSSIQQFSDIDTQRRRWLDLKNTNPHWSFIEYMCCYFDDIGLSNPNVGYEGWVAHGVASKEEVLAVSRFHAVADAYASPDNNDYDHAAILADPQWHKVVESAREAQQALAGMLSDPYEMVLLLEPLTGN